MHEQCNADSRGNRNTNGLSKKLKRETIQRFGKKDNQLVLTGGMFLRDD